VQESDRSAGLLSFLKRPVVIIVILALVIRLVLMPLLTYGFDIYHWALIISNIDNGNDLYGLDGYYYTPVWGYLVGTISAVQQFIMDIGPMGVRITELLTMENMVHPYHTATTTTIAFNVIMKIPMILCDFAVGYLIYWLIKDRTGDKKKATYGLAFWLFCPIVVYMSGVQAMFDTFSALLLLLAVIMIYKDHCFIGGALFSAAVLLKFFPGFCIFVILAYIYAKYRGDGTANKKLIETVAGIAIMSLILMLPLILNGQVGDALTFIFGRVGEKTLISDLVIYFTAAVAIFCAVLFGYRMYKTPKENADNAMFMYVMFAVAASTLISATPQYVIVIIPFLILFMLTMDRTYVKCWYIIGIAAMLNAFFLNNYSLLASLSESGIVSYDLIISGMQFMDANLFLGVSLFAILTTLAGVLQYLGVILLLAFCFVDDINKISPKLGAYVMRIKNWGLRNGT
jgi:Gpi18-like mannosyltransferase